MPRDAIRVYFPVDVQGSQQIEDAFICIAGEQLDHALRESQQDCIKEVAATNAP